ncbi:amidohydrolase family protein [Kribbella catacumbae]|uniref:amidohydrolase family protein n=1 Tax=Kribbella catacumbae TaxID=460086 RepID=UPI00036D4BB2|nr:amidohydrolase family protein [Kribbella catacumbae]
MIGIETDGVFDGERYSGGGAVVVVDGDRIVSVGPAGTALPPGCELTRFEGCTVLPGLIDAHVHLCCDSGPGALDRIPDFSAAELDDVIEESLRRQLASGVTTVRDLGDRDWAVIDWRARYADALLPTVLASGPPITVPEGHCWNMGGAVLGVDALREAVAERAARGADVVKIMASGGVNTPGSDPASVQFSTEELLVVVEESHARGLPVTAHAHSLDAIRFALAAGVDGIEHCSFITASGLAVDDTVVADLASTGTAICPTLGAVPGATPPPAVLEMMRRTGSDYETRIQLFGHLHAAGVRLISGSDAGINPGKAHGILPEAVIGLVEGGVAPTAALTTATAQAAATLNLPTKGRLAPGSDADLLVVLGDPTTDITALRTPQAVYLRGSRI